MRVARSRRTWGDAKAMAKRNPAEGQFGGAHREPGGVGGFAVDEAPGIQ